VPAAPSSSSLMRVAGYEVIEEIARGGMGIVYRARQLDPSRAVALKMLLPHHLASAGMAERFGLEVRALSELEHPSILPVHQMGEHDGLPFFTMKLATGGTLAQRKAEYGGNWRAIAELLVQLAEAVQFAHERGVLHRDLKPGNILFDDRGHPYVSDFGLAKLANDDAELTRSVDFLGTPHYVAPEVATRSARQATIASDIYSLGAILYELLAGRPPFEAEGVPALLKKIAEEDPLKPSAVASAGRQSNSEGRNPRTEQHKRGPLVGLAEGNPKTPPVSDTGATSEIRSGSGAKGPVWNSDFGLRVSALRVPRDLEVICLKCLAKEPARRYAAARDLAADLRRWLRGEPILARPVTTIERSWKWVQRNPVLAVLAAALAVSLIGGGLALWRSDREVRRALSTTRKAESQSQQNLREALLAQARALGAAHATGQRWAALEALSRAAQIRPALDLRNEATAALARPDLREVGRFAANIGGAGSTVVFTSDLDAYVAPEPAGGFALRRTKDQEVLANFPDAQGRPARWFVLSPDDREVAAVMNDYGIEIWPVGASQPRLKLKGTHQQPAVAEFHPRGLSLAGFTPADGLFIQAGEERHPLPSTNGRAIYLRYDPAGARLAVVRDPGGVELWRCTGVPALLWFQPMKQTVPWLAWSPDGSRLAAAANDGRGLRIFSAANGQTELVYSQHLLYPRQFEFDPSGRMIASMGDDWALRLWDAGTGQDLITSVGRHRVMRFSRDGRRLSTAPTDRELAILELAPEQVFREFRSTAAEAVTPSRLVRSADGRFIVTVHPQVRLFDTARAGEIGQFNLPIAAPKQGFFENDGSAIFYSIPGKGIYRREFFCSSNTTAGTVSFQWGEQKLLATQSNTIVWNSIESGKTWVRHGSDGVEIWPQRDPRQARRLAIRAPLERLAASQTGRWFAAPDYAKDTVTVWDGGSGRTVTNLSARGVGQVWFSPDGQWIVASIESGYCTWETGTWKPGASLAARLDSGDPGEIAFTDDSRLLVMRQEREIFRVLSFPDCGELVTLKPPLVVPVRSACLSADGRRLWLLAPGYRVFEWNLGQLQTELAKLGLDWEPK